jgi:hypothetical protein
MVAQTDKITKKTKTLEIAKELPAAVQPKKRLLFGSFQNLDAANY